MKQTTTTTTTTPTTHILKTTYFTKNNKLEELQEQHGQQQQFFKPKCSPYLSWSDCVPDGELLYYRLYSVVSGKFGKSLNQNSALFTACTKSLGNTFSVHMSMPTQFTIPVTSATNYAYTYYYSTNKNNTIPTYTTYNRTTTTATA